MPFNNVNNEDFSNMLFVKDSNGNWIPVSKIANLDHLNSPPADATLTGDIMITGEITLSDESAAQWWAIAQGGIEIVER